MADPVASLITSGVTAADVTSCVVNFTAQAAGTVLLLAAATDAYKTGDPSGWSTPTGGSQEYYLGGYVWYKIASGSETSVTYTIGSGAMGTAYVLIGITNIDGDTPVDISNGTGANNSDNIITPSVSTSSGRRIAVAAIGGSSSDRNMTGASAWTNSFSETGESFTSPGSGTQDLVAVGALVFDGGGSISTQATIDVGGGVQSHTAIITVFKNAAAAGGDVTAVPGAATAAGVAPDAGAALTVIGTTHLTG